MKIICTQQEKRIAEKIINCVTCERCPFRIQCLALKKESWDCMRYISDKFEWEIVPEQEVDVDALQCL